MVCRKYILFLCACVLSHFSRVRLLATPWTAARPSSPWDSAGKQTGVGCCAHPPRDLPSPGIEPAALKSPALADRFFTTSATWEAHIYSHPRPEWPTADMTINRKKQNLCSEDCEPLAWAVKTEDCDETDVLGADCSVVSASLRF